VPSFIFWDKCCCSEHFLTERNTVRTLRDRCPRNGGAFYDRNRGFHRYGLGRSQTSVQMQGFPTRGLLGCFMLAVATFSNCKGKAVPLQAWSGPEGSRKLRFPDYMTTAQDGGKVVNLTHRPPLPPRKCSWYSFLLKAEPTSGA
jgi:hypothetical protein